MARLEYQVGSHMFRIECEVSGPRKSKFCFSFLYFLIPIFVFDYVKSKITNKLAGLKGSGSGLTSGPPSSLTSPMTSPTSSPCHHPLRSSHHGNHHHHHHHHRGSIDSVFVDLDLSGSGTEFGAGGLSTNLGNGVAADAIAGGVVDLRALAKDRQKKDNHNMSKTIFSFLSRSNRKIAFLSMPSISIRQVLCITTRLSSKEDNSRNVC